MMFTKPTHCPNAACRYHSVTAERFFIKKGYFKTKWNRQPVPRYRCKGCGKFFSSHTFRDTFRQKKPFLNEQFFKLYAGGMTIRRIAIVLGCAKKTAERKFCFTARKARSIHEAKIAAGEIKTNYVLIDEQETFEHTKFRPLSIMMAVRAKDGFIIDAQVASFKTRGTHHAPRKYVDEYRPDQRPVAIEDVLLTVKKCTRNEADLTIESDEGSSYSQILGRILPQATYNRVRQLLPSYIPRAEQRKMRQPLFWMKVTQAKIRNDLSRMARKTWVTTKRDWGLQAHLDLYIAWNNRYKI